MNTDRIIGFNLFEYCKNNTINSFDDSGEARRSFNYHGWSISIDNENTSTKGEQHIAIENGKKYYAQNKSGKPHDKHRNSKGGPPNSIKKYLKEELNWDWDANEQKYKEHINEIRQALVFPWTKEYRIAYEEGDLEKPVVVEVTIVSFRGIQLTVPYDEYLEAGGTPYEPHPSTNITLMPIIEMPIVIPEFVAPLVPSFTF